MSASPRASLGFSVVDAPHYYRSKYGPIVDAIEATPASKAIEIACARKVDVVNASESIRQHARRRGLTILTRSYPKNGAYVLIAMKKEAKS